MPTYTHCMPLGLCCFHQQVDICQSTYGGIISSDLVCSFPLGSYYHLGLWLWGVSSSIEAQGEVNLPHAAPDRVNIRSLLID